MKSARSKSFALACFAGMIAMSSLAGCTSYYKVTDPASGKTFYTTDVSQSKRGGYVEFTDAVTKSQVTLQSSEVTKVSKEQFTTATGSK